MTSCRKLADTYSTYYFFFQYELFFIFHEVTHILAVHIWKWITITRYKTSVIACNSLIQGCVCQLTANYPWSAAHWSGHPHHHHAGSWSHCRNGRHIYSYNCSSCPGCCRCSVCPADHSNIICSRSWSKTGSHDSSRKYAYLCHFFYDSTDFWVLIIFILHVILLII